MSDNLELRVRREDGLAIVEAIGYINNLGGGQIVSECDKLLADGVKKIILNLEQCSIVNSVGIAFLIEAIERVKERGGQLAFCCVAPTIAKTFRIMGLLQNATIYDTEQEARQALAG